MLLVCLFLLYIWNTTLCGHVVSALKMYLLKLFCWSWRSVSALIFAVIAFCCSKLPTSVLYMHVEMAAFCYNCTSSLRLVICLWKWEIKLLYGIFALEIWLFSPPSFPRIPVFKVLLPQIILVSGNSHFIENKEFAGSPIEISAKFHLPLLRSHILLPFE